MRQTLRSRDLLNQLRTLPDVRQECVEAAKQLVANQAAPAEAAAESIASQLLESPDADEEFCWRAA